MSLVDAVASGRPVVATAFPHAVELLATGAGIVVAHDDPDALVSALRRVLTEPRLAGAMAAEARRWRRMAWQVVAGAYLGLARRVLAQRTGTGVTTTSPAPIFDHLLRLTDRRGTVQRARLAEPVPEHGYRTDDAARVLAVATRDHGPDRILNGLARLALQFLSGAQALTGACRNRMDSTGSWVDEPALEDAWGLCIWGLGTAAATAMSPGPASRQSCSSSAPRKRVRSGRARWRSRRWALRNSLPSTPNTRRPRVAYRLCRFSACSDRDPTWPWPEPRLTYANAVLPGAMIAAGAALADATLRQRGLDLLAWLVSFETAAAICLPPPLRAEGPRTRGPVSISSPSRYPRSPMRARTPRPSTTEPDLACRRQGRSGLVYGRQRPGGADVGPGHGCRIRRTARGRSEQ